MSRTDEILRKNGLDPTETHSAASIARPSGSTLESIDPTTGQVIGRVQQAALVDYEAVMAKTTGAFDRWRMMPAPARGEIVRQIGEALRTNREALGELVSLEMGKIRAEGIGEVQEAVDIADFAVGLSRQLYGKTMHSERPHHRMYEQWHPLGTVGIITAFNFPVAVWAWNAMIAAVCGDVCIWKPSPVTPLTAIATQRLIDEVLLRNGVEGVMTLCLGETDPVGLAMVADPRIPLISATGSCRMGREVAQVVAKRMARCLLELGGNNALIVADDADLDIALPGILFGAAGTSGQRCTTTRRLYVQAGIHDELVQRLEKAYAGIRIGDPLADGTLMGPLVNAQAVAQYDAALAKIPAQGGDVFCQGGSLDGLPEGGYWVRPTLVSAPHDMPIIQTETFAPILYIIKWNTLDEVIAWNNDVPQGLSSAIFTRDVITAETFLSHAGSDCGIANVNIGTSGAEIGGAFGGEKETGGGREAGSDSWKQYMRRQTCTINWGRDLPLAQGIEFG